MIFNGYNSAETLFDRLSRVNRLRETDGSGTILTEYDYNGTGRVSEARYPVPSVRNSFHGNDSDGDYEGWDRFGRTLFQAWYKYSSPTGTQDRWNYTYDYAGNRLTRDLDPAQVSGAPTDHDQVYTYDGLQRLANFQQGTIGSGVIVTKKFEQDWTLDQLGNWPTFKQDDDGNGTWDLDQSRSHNEVNELTEFTTTSWVDPAHDAAGNMTTMPQPKNPSSGYTAVYDAWNRLVLLHNNPTFWQINEYDGLGRRIIRDDVGSGGYVHHFYYNEQWQVLEERKNGDTDPLNQYVWHPYYIDALAVRYYDATTGGTQVRHWYLQDANFNVTSVVNDSGTVLERYRYSPYGEVTILDANFAVDADQISDINNNYLYTGRERDPETGLQLNRNRFYHAKLGRWMTRDPIGYEGGINLYEYVGSQPNSGVDPDGLWILPILRGIMPKPRISNNLSGGVTTVCSGPHPLDHPAGGPVDGDHYRVHAKSVRRENRKRVRL